MDRCWHVPMEENVARDFGEDLISNIAGVVEEVTGDEVIVKEDGTNKKFRYQVLKFKRSNQATSWNQKPLVKVGDKIKTIRFGQQGVTGAGKNPKTAKDKARKKSYYARHNAQDAKPSKLSARYWSHKVKW